MNSPLDNTAWVVNLLNDIKGRVLSWDYDNTPRPNTVFCMDGGEAVPRLVIQAATTITVAVKFDGDAVVNGESCRWSEVKDKILAMCDKAKAG